MDNEDCQERVDQCYHKQLCKDTSEILGTELCAKSDPLVIGAVDTCEVSLSSFNVLTRLNFEKKS